MYFKNILIFISFDTFVTIRTCINFKLFPSFHKTTRLCMCSHLSATSNSNCIPYIYRYFSWICHYDSSSIARGVKSVYSTSDRWLTCVVFESNSMYIWWLLFFLNCFLLFGCSYVINAYNTIIEYTQHNYDLLSTCASAPSPTKGIFAFWPVRQHPTE